MGRFLPRLGRFLPDPPVLEGWDVPRECGSLLGLQAWGISAFAVPFALATDSVHLFVGGDLLLRTGFKRQIPSDL